MTLTVFHFIALGAVVLLGAVLFVVLFEPGLPYEINAKLPPTDTHEFLGLVAALIDAAVLGRSRIDVLTNGSRVA